jgi:hypothetical protein
LIVQAVVLMIHGRVPNSSFRYSSGRGGLRLQLRKGHGGSYKPGFRDIQEDGNAVRRDDLEPKPGGPYLYRRRVPRREPEKPVKTVQGVRKQQFTFPGPFTWNLLDISHIYFLFF